MKEIVLITGASGMVAQRLSKLLEPQYEVRFLTRRPSAPNHFRWDIENQYIDTKSLVGVSHIVHLAGVSIAESRWTKRQKQQILQSRTASARLLLKEIKEGQKKLKTFVSASAIGIYGTKTTNVIYDETTSYGDDFLSEVCQKWEAIADEFNQVALCVTKLRFGVIFDQNLGVLPKMIKPISLGLGAVLGKGNQYMAWVSLNDVCRSIIHIINNRLSGVYNIVSENKTQEEVTFILAKYFKKTIWLPSIPSFFIRWIFGEVSVLLLEGSQISNEKIKNTGFEFEEISPEDFLRKNVVVK